MRGNMGTTKSIMNKRTIEQSKYEIRSKLHTFRMSLIQLFNCSSFKINFRAYYQIKITTVISIFLPTLIFTAVLLNSCSTTEKLSDKSGVQLWGENCSRCHTAPPPTAYSDHKWETVGTHMKIRANLTQYEETKIIEFLKTANEE
jgi:hypothetical protein